MSVTISEALQQAQDAISSGNYRSAVNTCGQLVQQFPSYAAAHRLLGEAWLEQGQNSEAERAFTAALSGNPRHPWAYLGLGLIAEDRGANDPALAFTQVAWELAPNVAQLREPVRRTAMRRYGADGQLQFTRAALAQLHANNARPQRAATEYRAALAELPDRLDLQLGYAEVLWRLGQDADAANLCRELLEHHPDAVQALVILADIEHRGGDARRADAWLARVRAVDPDGAVTAAMLAANPRADRAWLALSADAVPVVVEGGVAAAPDMPHIAPAPDFEYVPSRPDARPANMADLRPMELEEFGGEPVDAPAADAGLLLEDFDEQPFDPGDLAGSGLSAAGSAAAGLGAAAVAGLGLAAAAFRDHDDEAVVDAPPMAAADHSEVDALPMAAADQPWPDAGDDELGSLAAALEGDIAGALARAGSPAEPLPFSEDPADNLPPDVAPAGYTSMLRELGDEGLAPFDVLDRSMPAPELPDDLLAAEVDDLAAATAAPDVSQAAAMAALESLANDWDAIDSEINSAVPWDVPAGYTDELRSLEGIGLEPFDVDDESGAAGPGFPAALAAAALDQPESAAEPSLEALLAEAPVAEAEVDLLAAMQMEDVEVALPVEAESVAVVETPEEEIDTQVDMPAVGLAAAALALDDVVMPDAAEAAVSDDAVFADLEPFAAEDFDGPLDGQTKQFSFGPAPWDTAGREGGAARSAVPSDADFEEILAAAEAEQAAAHEIVTTEVSPPPMPEPVYEPAPQAVDAPEMQAFNTDELPTANLPSGWEPPATTWTDREELNDMFGSSLAVTRALGATEEAPATPESAAPPVMETPEAPSAPAAAAESFADSIDDIAVFDRARAAKSELIEVGAISGNLELGAEEAAVEPQPEAAPEPDESDPARVTGTGAFRDADTLRAALAADPNDPELHWWLADALRQRGDVADAIGEYRWLVRNAPDRVDAVIEALNTCIQNNTETEQAHRVLADIYRRRGDSARASRHAAMSLQSHRRARG